MNETSKKLLDTFGKKAEILKAISEFSELSAALSEYMYCIETMNERSASVVIDEVLEEMGDAGLTLNTLAHIFGTGNFQKALKDSIGKAHAVMSLEEFAEGEKEASVSDLQRRCY